MIFQAIIHSIVLICWMIGAGNFQFPGEIRFDKRMNSNDKIQFSFLIRGRDLPMYVKPEVTEAVSGNTRQETSRNQFYLS